MRWFGRDGQRATGSDLVRRGQHTLDAGRRPNAMLIAVLFEAGLGLLACLVGWLLGRSPWWCIDWTLEAVVVGIAATLPIFLLLVWMARSRRTPLARLTDVVTELVAELFGRTSWPGLLLVATLAGFGEELLFRGLIQDQIGAAYGPTVGLVAASVLFGLMHPLTGTYAVLAAVIGAYLGWLWLQFDNLLVPIVTHSLYDWVALVYLRDRHAKKSGPTHW